MMNFTKSARILIAAAAFSAAANASTVFNFANDALGTTTTFTDTVNGLSAKFSTPADPGGFIVYGSIFNSLGNNVLGDPGPANAGGIDLTIAFGKNLSALTLDFATADFGSASPLSISAYENNKLVGSSSAIGALPAGFTFPEGVESFSGQIFNNVVISSAAPDFAIGNISATTAPEPAVSALFGLGLLGLGLPAFWRRSKRNKTTY